MEAQAADAIHGIFAEGVLGIRSPNSDKFQEAVPLFHSFEKVPRLPGGYIYFCPPLVRGIRIRNPSDYLRVVKAEVV